MGDILFFRKPYTEPFSVSKIRISFAEIYQHFKQRYLKKRTDLDFGLKAICVEKLVL